MKKKNPKRAKTFPLIWCEELSFEYLFKNEGQLKNSFLKLSSEDFNKELVSRLSWHLFIAYRTVFAVLAMENFRTFLEKDISLKLSTIEATGYASTNRRTKRHHEKHLFSSFNKYLMDPNLLYVSSSNLDTSVADSISYLNGLLFEKHQTIDGHSKERLKNFTKTVFYDSILSIEKAIKAKGDSSTFEGFYDSELQSNMSALNKIIQGKRAESKNTETYFSSFQRNLRRYQSSKKKKPDNPSQNI